MEWQPWINVSRQRLMFSNKSNNSWCLKKWDILVYNPPENEKNTYQEIYSLLRFSGNEHNELVFITKVDFFHDVFHSRKSIRTWQIIRFPALGSKWNDLNYEGHYLYFEHNNCCNEFETPKHTFRMHQRLLILDI